MKLVLYIDGKRTVFERDIPSLHHQNRQVQKDRIRFESVALRRLGERSGKDWKIILEVPSKANGLEIRELERPPAIYSNKSPMGIAKGD